MAWSAVFAVTAALLGPTAPPAAARPDGCDPPKTVTQFAHAVIQNDHDEIRALTTANVAWSIPGHNRISGQHSGQAAVIELADLLAQYGVRIAVRAYTFGTDNIAVELHDSGRRDGAGMDQDVVNVVSISADCKILSVDQHVADLPEFDAYFA